jgi:hypothetical protein
MRMRALVVLAGLTVTTAGFAAAQQRGPAQGSSGSQAGQDRPPPPRDGQGQGQGQGQHGGQNGQHGRRPTSRPSPDEVFDRVDTNHDGSLSREEFKAFLAHLPPPPPRDGNGDRPPPPPPRDGD